MVSANDEFVATEAGRAKAAQKDLDRIEQEIMAEAEAAVEDFDAMGDEHSAAEAAETAFEFKEAQMQV